MNNKKELQNINGPKFLRFFVPIVDVLSQIESKSLKSNQVIERILEDYNISEDEQKELLNNGTSRIRNQIGWARFYMVKSNFLKANSPRGVWELTEKAEEFHESNQLNEEYIYSTFKKIHDSFNGEVEINEEQSIEPEELEGLEDDAQIELDEDDNDAEKGKTSIYPYNSENYDLDIKEEKYSVFDFIKRKMERGDIITDPDFQRNFVWDSKKMSRFIESIILNIPLPPLYVNETKEGKLIVIDGKQRTTTLQKYMNDEFALKNIEAIPDLNGKKFSDLPDKIKRKIEDKQLLFNILKPSVSFDVVYDIFNRINANGTPLNRQEIRNCIYKGNSTALLNELSKDDIFKKAIDYGIVSKRMKDREAIIRYLSFRIQGYQKYNSSMSSYIETTMQEINLMNDLKIEELKRDFLRVMRTTYEFFGESNFRIPINKSRGKINLAVFESVALFFSNRKDDYLYKNKEIIKSNYKKLVSDDNYKNAVTSSTSDKKKVITRFELAEEILSEYTLNKTIEKLEHDTVISFELTNEELEKLNMPVNGIGGWQTLLRELQNFVKGNKIEINQNLKEKILKYGVQKGGFQYRILPIVEKLKDELP